MIITGNPAVSVQDMFQNVQSENTPGLFASEGPLFYGAVFGRDSLEASEHILPFEPYIPRYNTLQVLASLQGLAEDKTSEEEPGKIHHEYRHTRNIRNAADRKVFESLSQKWGGSSEEMTYYGSIDATPLFVRLSTNYIERYGAEILEERIVGRDGEARRFADHLRMALDWCKRRIADSEIGLIEYKRANPLGIENQVWKDSIEAYVHTDGEKVNFDGFPVAPLEVQGYAYDALKKMSQLFPGSVSGSMLKDFGQSVLEKFWLPDKQLFAQALDRDASGRVHRVSVPSSNAGLLLDSELLLDFPYTKPMIEATVDMLMGPDFLTPAGIRCRSLKAADIIDFPDYHGSYAVWAKDTANIMRGMLKHGYEDEARQLAQRIVDNIARHDQEFYEFNFVDEDNNVIHPKRQAGLFSDRRCNKPEPGQTWSISAFLYAMHLLSGQRPEAA